MNFCEVVYIVVLLVNDRFRSSVLSYKAMTATYVSLLPLYDARKQNICKALVIVRCIVS